MCGKRTRGRRSFRWIRGSHLDGFNNYDDIFLDFLLPALYDNVFFTSKQPSCEMLTESAAGRSAPPIGTGCRVSRQTLLRTVRRSDQIKEDASFLALTLINIVSKKL
jgi:hypothetical protein